MNNCLNQTFHDKKDASKTPLKLRLRKTTQNKLLQVTGKTCSSSIRKKADFSLSPFLYSKICKAIATKRTAYFAQE
jgi:hypothetical protein